jgi:hypothetical protein
VNNWNLRHADARCTDGRSRTAEEERKKRDTRGSRGAGGRIEGGHTSTRMQADRIEKRLKSHDPFFVAAG